MEEIQRGYEYRLVVWTLANGDDAELLIQVQSIEDSMSEYGKEGFAIADIKCIKNFGFITMIYTLSKSVQPLFDK